MSKNQHRYAMDVYQHAIAAQMKENPWENACFVLERETFTRVKADFSSCLLI